MTKGNYVDHDLPEISQVSAQVEKLVALGVPELAGHTTESFSNLASELLSSQGLIAIHPKLVKPSVLAQLMQREGKPGFVVSDLNDLEEFHPIDEVEIPDQPLYVIYDVQRGDDMSNWSPVEALPEILSRGRRPLTVSEGISWLLQQPEALDKNRCFMTIASRKRKTKGQDSRTPAIWISGGTGRDGKTRRGAPKVGWCWAGNRHTWLGFASTSG